MVDAMLDKEVEAMVEAVVDAMVDAMVDILRFRSLPLQSVFFLVKKYYLSIVYPYRPLSCKRLHINSTILVLDEGLVSRSRG